MTIWPKRQQVDFVFSDQNNRLDGGTLFPQLPWKQGLIGSVLPRLFQDFGYSAENRPIICGPKWGTFCLHCLSTMSCRIWLQHGSILIELYSASCCCYCSNLLLEDLVLSLLLQYLVQMYHSLSTHADTTALFPKLIYCSALLSYCCIIKMLLHCSGLCYLIATFILVLCQLTVTFYGCPATILLQYSMGS